MEDMELALCFNLVCMREVIRRHSCDRDGAKGSGYLLTWLGSGAMWLGRIDHGQWNNDLICGGVAGGSLRFCYYQKWALSFHHFSDSIH